MLSFFQKNGNENSAIKKIRSRIFTKKKKLVTRPNILLGTILYINVPRKILVPLFVSPSNNQTIRTTATDFVTLNPNRQMAKTNIIQKIPFGMVMAPKILIQIHPEINAPRLYAISALA